MADSPPTSSAKDAQETLRKLFHSGEYHDLTIRCGDRVWKVHRAIICPQSKYFTKACTGGFKEAETKEIVLEGDEPDLIDRMLCWFYTREYREKMALYFLTEVMVTEAKMYAMADKYELDDLKEVAKTAFRDALERQWDMDQFVVAAEVVYTSTPDSDRGLRNIITAFTWSKQTTLLARKDVQGLLSDLGGFSRDLLQEICKTASSPAPAEPDRYCVKCYGERTFMVNDDYPKDTYVICRSCIEGLRRVW